MSESTEPRAAAREIIAEWYNSGSTLTADDLIDSLESSGVLATIAPTEPTESRAAAQIELPVEVYESVGDALTTFFDTDQWSTADFQHTVAYVVESVRSAILDAGYTITPTDPLTAARKVIFSALDGARVVPPDDLDTATDAVLAVLATIAPDDPGRVVIDLDTLRCWRDDAESAANESASAIGLLMDIQQAITAAERAATGENYE